MIHGDDSDPEAASRRREEELDEREHSPQVRFCIQCKRSTTHRYVHRSWTCTECGKDEWL